MGPNLPDIDLQLQESTDQGDSACAVDLDEELEFDPADLDRPLLIWDGTCGFCRRSVVRINDEVGDRVHIAPYQLVHQHFEDIDEEDFAEAVHLVEPDGTFCNGAEAVFRALAQAPGARGGWLWSYMNLPGFRGLTEWGYKQVAEHRPIVDRVTRWFSGEDLRASRWSISRWIFLRLLALVAIIAFASLAVQVVGLAGPSGIVPAVDTVERLHQVAAEQGVLWTILRHPTLFWLFDPTSAVLWGTCIAGGTAGLLLFVGIWPRLMLSLAWAAYLSLATVCGPFLGYQWDALLLESLFLAIFVAPAGIWPRWRPARVSRGAVFLVHWLAFRLMFMSGVVKIASSGGTWRELSALQYHFWTQPLPTWTAWYVDQLPAVLLGALTVGTLVLELLVPLLVLAPRRPRRWAAAALAALQVGILLTGNYGFFNLLALVVLVLLVDDAVWRRWLPIESIGDFDADPPARQLFPPPTRLGLAGISGLVGFVVLVTTFNMTNRFATMAAGSSNPLGAPKIVGQGLATVDRYRTFNNYGLFANMTTRRPELVIEGSRDGQNWKSYRFRWKPGDLDRRPRFATPHMPRLDWQMWFQALYWQDVWEETESCPWIFDIRQKRTRTRWYLAFQRRLLEGSPAVEALLASNPFADRPPKYIRTRVWQYRFAEAGSGRWWQRVEMPRMCPPLTFKDGRMKPVRLE